jgi:hypothetical protein
MRRLTKRGLILGIAGLMMVIGVGTASSVSANTTCAGATDDKYCASELHTYVLSTYLNPNIVGDFGDAASNIQPTLAQRNAYDSLVTGSGDRVPNS